MNEFNIHEKNNKSIHEGLKVTNVILALTLRYSDRLLRHLSFKANKKFNCRFCDTISYHTYIFRMILFPM